MPTGVTCVGPYSWVHCCCAQRAWLVACIHIFMPGAAAAMQVICGCRMRHVLDIFMLWESLLPCLWQQVGHSVDCDCDQDCDCCW
jgi:hypothetical protein